MAPSDQVIIWINIHRMRIESRSPFSQVMLRAIEVLAGNAARDGKVYLMELKITGYEDDPRELFEIPEVCNWARAIFESSPGLWFFLGKASQLHFLGWMCGPVLQDSSPEFSRLAEARWKEATDRGLSDGERWLAKYHASPALIAEYRAYHHARSEG